MFQSFLNNSDNFHLRRAVERLREGLFDPLGVRMLTSGEAKLDQVFDKGVKALEKGASFHQCICGAYGQGKSHSLNYIQQRALEQGFVVSTINLDPGKAPFHNFKQVYKSLMAGMAFPENENPLFVNVWKTRAVQWLSLPENKGKELNDLIPETIPHRFRAVLAALAQENMSIPSGKRNLKKYAGFKPREFPWVLKNAIMGKDIPVWRLRPALYYRQVCFYREYPLTCGEPNQYLDLVQGLAQLFCNIGFKGWVMLFDEGEAICQTRVTSRSKSYKLLDKIFDSQSSTRGFYPVFAFTPDFFIRLQDEQYDPVTEQKGSWFEKNYFTAWKNINIHNLHDLSKGEWKTLIEKLILLHAGAYKWSPPAVLMENQMNQALLKYNGVEPRLKFKLLVNLLDLEQQKNVCDTTA